MLAGIHFFGALLLLAAGVLFLITTITAPAIHHLSILDVNLSNSRTVRFGTFGWCTVGDSSGDLCIRNYGYSPTLVINGLDSSAIFSGYATTTTRALTRVMILHPIVTGLAFIGAVLGAASGIIGSFIASLIALVTFLAALVALICDFVMFSIIKSSINNSSTSVAHYSTGIWTLLAGTVCALFASAILFLTCCFGRRDRRARKHGFA